MYARSTTLHGKPANVDAGLKFVEREVAPSMNALEGCLGLSCLVNRESGMAIVTTSWASEESMRDSDALLRPARERGREIFNGSMQVDEWEIALMHRADHGMCARVTWVQGELEALLDVFRYNAMPNMEEIPGYCSSSVLMNLQTGIGCVTTAYDTRRHLEASRPMADMIRARTTEQAGTEVVDVQEFDLAIAHLHVPEMV